MKIYNQLIIAILSTGLMVNITFANPVTDFFKGIFGTTNTTSIKTGEVSNTTTVGGQKTVVGGTTVGSTTLTSSFTTSDIITIKNFAELIQANQDSTKIIVEKQAESFNKLLETFKNQQVLQVKQNEEWRKVIDQVIASPPKLPIINGNTNLDVLLKNSETTPTVFKQEATQNQLLINTLTNLNTTLQSMSIPSTGAGPAVITQANTFTGGEALYITSAGIYTRAQANSAITADYVGTVAFSPAPTLTTFALAVQAATISGYPAATFTIGGAVFLSDSIAGGVTQVELTNPASTRKVIGIATSATAYLIENQIGTPVVGQTAVVNSGVNNGIVDQNYTTASLTDIVGSPFTLSVAGTYLINYSVSARSGTTKGNVQVVLTDNSGTVVPGTNRTTPSYVTNAQMILTGQAIVTTAVPAVYKLQVATGGVTANVTNSGSSQSTITWTQIGGTPIPMSLAGEYGENIGLGTQTTTSITAVDAIGGSFTLPSAGVWAVTYYINTLNSTSPANIFFQFADTSNNVVPNSTNLGTSGVANATFNVVQKVYITTSGPATYKLQWSTSAGTATLRNNAAGSSNITYQKVSGFIPTSGSTVDYASGRLLASQAVPNTGSDHVKFDQTINGNITLDTSTTYTTTSGVPSIGRITLQAGKTYDLKAFIGEFTGTANNNYRAQWFDVTTGTPVAIGNGVALSLTYSPGLAQLNQVASAIFTPAVTTLVELRLTNWFAGTISGSTSYPTWFEIKQLGSTAVTSNTRVAVSAGFGAGGTFSGTTIVTNWTTATDPTNSFNAATGVFTAPRAGNYMVTANMMWGNNTWAAGNVQALGIFKNGVQVANDIWSAWSAQTSQYPSTKAALIPLAAGDTIDIRISSSKAGGAILQGVIASNQLSIVEINSTF